ncbi:hypothetical protein [Tolypothrix sp. VBCCA 56010]|uniref:hypothetical protein n=1 Tax=Tolypothrix sp. VBCCA 56010 TaxID=3137731 RepID=UPI003D7EC1FD
MSEAKYLKQIQSRLSRRKIKVSYDDIRPLYSEQCADSNPTEEQLSAIVEDLAAQHQQTAIVAPSSDEIDLSVAPQTTEDLADFLPELPEPETAVEEESTETQLTIAEPSTLSQPPAPPVTITPQEAVDIIQAIAKDDTSRNKALAQQLLEQAHHKTDSLVALVSAMPDIEAEMLKRKLQKMPRKRVDYEGVLDSYFRESTNFTHFVKDLAAEYGVTL